MTGSGDELAQLVLYDYIDGKKGRGRPMIMWAMISSNDSYVERCE